ncbi:MAG: hypothetical protein K6B73_05940 [Treponema sp.]|nr:hypothetical protein [Treponema sp.]
MTKRSFNIVSVLIGAVLLISVIYFVTGIVTDKKAGPSQAQVLFDSLAKKTEVIANKYDYNSSAFADSFMQAVKDFDDYASLELVMNGNTLYSYPSTKANTIDTQNYTKDFTKSFNLNNGNNLVIKAQIYTVKPSSLFYHARTAFILIFIATLIAILILIFAKPEGSCSKDKVIKFNHKDSFDDNPFRTDNVAVESLSDNGPVEEDATVEELQEEISSPSDFLSNEEDTSLSFSDNEVYTAEEAEEQDTSDEEIQDKPIITATISEEEALLPALEEELIHSASQEQDLSLIIVRIAGIQNDNPDSAQAACIKNCVNERGSAYRYGTDSYALLIKALKLDDALQDAESLLERLAASLRDQGLPAITIGISSRTERLISAERLLTEASEAQKHASDDMTSPIIAFRVNPEKYRNFILNN